MKRTIAPPQKKGNKQSSSPRPTTFQADTLKWALNYAKRGWKVFPIWSVDAAGVCTCPKHANCKPSDIGKHPCTPNGHLNASGDLQQITKWFGPKAPPSNIGIATGTVSGLTVLDVDTNNGKRGAETWAALIEDHGEPVTLMAQTGSGGTHVLFQYTETTKSGNNRLGPNVDCKNDGGYIVVCPSRHKSGGVYTWLNWGVPLALLPEHLTKKKETRGRPPKGDLRRQTFTLEEVKGMLTNISAEDRDLWRHVGIILGRTYGRSEAAWTVYTDWSNTWGGPKGKKHNKIMNEAFHDLSKQDVEQGLSIGTIVKLAQEAGWAPKTGDVPVEDLAYYVEGNNYLYRSTGKEWVAAAVDAVVSPLNIDGKVIKASVWLKSHDPITSITCDPAITGNLLKGFNCLDGTLVEAVGATVLNMYRHPTIKLGKAAKAGTWLDHTRLLLNKPGDADQMLNYLAHRVQHPGVKPRFALLVAGEQGCGKDTIVDMAVSAIGAWNVKSIEPRHLESPYNKYKVCTLLRIHEAADLAEMSKWAFNEATKTLIAGEGENGCEINPKYGHQFTMRLYCGVILTTNYLLTGIFIPQDDRRYDVMECATFAEMGLTTEPAKQDYFDGLYDWARGGGYAHVAAFLHERDLTGWSPDHGRKTEAHHRVVQANRVSDHWLFDILDDLEAAGYDTTLVRGDWIISRAEFHGEKRMDVQRKLLPTMLRCGYVQYRNPDNKEGRWPINKHKRTVYAKLSTPLGLDVQKLCETDPAF